MANDQTCPICGAEALTPSTFEGQVKHDGIVLSVRDLECFVCSSCGADPVFEDQIKRNQVRIADAKRQAQGLLTGREIRSARESLGLTQVQAATLFGGGPNAFSKYERGDVVQSSVMDRVIRAAIALPEFFSFLVDRYGEGLGIAPPRCCAEPISEEFHFDIGVFTIDRSAVSVRFKESVQEEVCGYESSEAA